MRGGWGEGKEPRTKESDTRAFEKKKGLRGHECEVALQHDYGGDNKGRFQYLLLSFKNHGQDLD